MTRPTREQVEYALEAVQFDCRSYRNNARVLAAEVHALRLEIEVLEDRVQQALAHVARVETERDRYRLRSPG